MAKKSTKPMTRAEVLRRVKGLTGGQRAAAICGLVGHSRLSTCCFGYRYCGRCEAQVGDNLGGVDPGAETCVMKGHNCKICRKNMKAMTWRDTLGVPGAATWHKPEPAPAA